MSQDPLIYIVAGEPSGDLLAGRLMAALRDRTDGRVRFAGVGAESMAEEGVESLFPLADIAVMGLAEVLPRLPTILRRLRQTVEDIEQRRPDAVVTIDSWGFTGRLVKTLKKRGFTGPLIHYVAPMVWVWKEGRARHMAEVIDHLMTLLPNEPPYFQRHGLSTTHVGHSVLEAGADHGDGAAFRARHALAPETELLAVLPGSRHSETSRLLPVMGEAVGLLALRHPNLVVAVPTVATVADHVREVVRHWPVRTLIVEGRSERYDCFAAARVALAASGTVALELAMAKLPMVITYKVSPLTALIGRRLIKIRFFCLLNILLGREAVPELMQENCLPGLLAEAVEQLWADGPPREGQLAATAEALTLLGQGVDSPSHRAADLVLSTLKGEV